MGCTAREHIFIAGKGCSVQFAEIAGLVVFIGISCKCSRCNGNILGQVDGKLYALAVLDGIVFSCSVTFAALYAATVIERPW